MMRFAGNLPLWAQCILHPFRHMTDHDSLLDDLTEIHGRKSVQGGRRAADWWLFRQVCGAVPQLMMNDMAWRAIMVANYFKMTVRTVMGSKVYTFVNLTGLGLGMACCIIMLLYVRFELSYDRFHVNSRRIVRLADSKGGSADIPVVPPPEMELSDVEKSCRLFTYAWREKALLNHADVFFHEPHFYLADAAVLDVFSFDFVSGNPEGALTGINDVLLSESAARRYFGDADAVGKVLSVKNLGGMDYVVRGVFRDWPAASHFRPEVLGAWGSGESLFWSGFAERNHSYCYCLLREGADPKQLETEMRGYYQKHLGRQAQYVTPLLQPLESIHLDSHLGMEAGENGHRQNIVLFSALALLVLTVACFNYINLVVARSGNRALEVGLRKVMGAGPRQLRQQFLGESVAMSLAALPLALLMAGLLLPGFSTLVRRQLPAEWWHDAGLWGGGLLLTLLVGLVSGLYPAFCLAALQPGRILKGRKASGSGSAVLRNTLVTLQYALSVLFLVMALFVGGQMRFAAHSQSLTDAGHVMLIPLKDQQSLERYQRLKQSFLASPSVLSVTASHSVPGHTGLSHGVWHEGLPMDEEVPMVWNGVDCSFFETYGLQLKSGRLFDATRGDEAKNAYIINESAARMLGWDEPVGKAMHLSNRGLKKAEYIMGRVVGVVEDFHLQSLHEPIAPLVLHVNQDRLRTAAVRIRHGQRGAALAHVKAVWKEVNPERPLSYTFLSDDVGSLYTEERRLARVLQYATWLTLLVAGLGLWGLTAFSVVQRRREIGIRKVLGAGAGQMVTLLAGQYTRWVLLANAMALPAAWWLTRQWMAGFAYHIDITPWPFAAALGASTLLAWLVVGMLSLGAALENPARVLYRE